MKAKSERCARPVLSAAFRARRRSMCPAVEVTPHPRRSGLPPRTLPLPSERAEDFAVRAEGCAVLLPISRATGRVC
jgi:hypothetical protein